MFGGIPRSRYNAQQLGLKDVVPVVLQPLPEGRAIRQRLFPREDFEAAGSPFSGGPVSVPLTPGPHFGTPGYGGPHVNTLHP